MANIDTLDLSEPTSKAEGANSAQEGKGVEGSSDKGVDEVAGQVSKSASPTRDASPALSSPGSGLVPLRGTPLNGSTPPANNAPTISMPHPKKFSHVDINKRFLGKNSATSSTSQTPSASGVSKPGSAIQKPVLQTTPSHSRLVTAKLTADPQRSTTTGPGWSRPSSTSSSIAQTPSIATNPKPTPVPPPVTGSVVPQLVPIGKVIQPQLRASTETLGSIGRKDSTGKPAWTHSKASASLMGGSVQNDFPTAAEVAQVRSAKLQEKKEAAQAAAAQKEALAAEADAFRGVHLAPNAHHWDEDEGDDSNFLDEVIQFDDGRQYTISQQAEPHSPPHDQAQSLKGADGSSKPPTAQDRPVSKEERFADDFDRSWPRSKNSDQRAPPPHMSPSSTSSHSMHSPQDPSRVLFNERSNRLEPYSTHPSNRFGTPRESYFPGRGGRSEYVSSPTEARNARDAPPHAQGMHLLQKQGQTSPDDTAPRSRLFGDHPGHSPWQDNSRPRDRDSFRRDQPAPFMSRTTSQGFDQGRSRDQYNSPVSPSVAPDRPRRLSNMGPPPLPPHSPGASETSKDGRQLPPHLSGTHAGPSMWRSGSSAERPRRPSAASSSGNILPSLSPVQQPSHSPVASHVSLSPHVTESPLQSSSTMPGVDIEEVRKAAMHSAAERARLRRQQEEEEREREKERARKKAAELEVRLKVTSEVKVMTSVEETVKRDQTEAEVMAIIEDAVQSVAASLPTEASLVVVPREPSKKVLTRTPFVREPTHTGLARSSSGSFVPAEVSSPALEVESWRAKPTTTKLIAHDASEPVTKLPPPSLPLMEEVEAFNLETDGNVEIVDFSDHGKLIGVHKPPAHEPRPSEKVQRPPRPVTTDFFDDDDDEGILDTRPSIVKSDEGSWRRAASQPTVNEDSNVQSVPQLKEKPKLMITPAPHFAPPPAALSSVPTSSEEARSQTDHGAVGNGPTNHLPLRSPQVSTYREAPMSALTDTMARIKGALDGMHYRPEPPQKWLPPALRPRETNDERAVARYEHIDHDDHTHREIFDVTTYAPPTSPKPAWNHFMVRLPRTSKKVEPIAQKRVRMFATQPHVRADIYSFVPPIEGMNRRDFHINDVIFRRPSMINGQPKCIVALPRMHTTQPSSQRTFVPVVNLPSKAANAKTGSGGAFGRSRDADGISSWRRPPSSPLKTQQPVEGEIATLDTISRSPPPEASSNVHATPTSGPNPEVVSLTVSVPPIKSKSQPKIPEGSGVAFYRGSRISHNDSHSKPTVSFIVSSELEEETMLPRLSDPLNFSQTEALPSSSVVQMPSFTSALEKRSMSQTVSSSDDPIVEFRKGNRSPVQAAITPPSQTNSLPRGKSSRETPVKDRAPNPEHLKAVWSSTSNKPKSTPHNSLEAIADDLTVVPFSIQDAKLEGAEIPPSSSSSHPSRMSLHDVTRTFQQVPSASASSSSASLRTAPLPPVASPTQRPLTMPMPPPMMQAGMRPAYPGYPSPMMSSPSPTIVYSQAMSPSPIPRPMVVNGPSQYPQPIWMPVPQPNGPNPGGMMRPMTSPYGPQLMHYPPPAGAMPMYPPPPPNAQSSTSPQPNGQGRPPGMVMSPSASQAQAAMYSASPVLMHAMPRMAMPPGSGYPTGTPGRGQPPRSAYDNMQGVMHPSPSYLPQGPYPSVPPSSFVRSPW